MFPNTDTIVPPCSCAHCSSIQSFACLLACPCHFTHSLAHAECTFDANTYTHCRFIVIIILSNLHSSRHHHGWNDCCSMHTLCGICTWNSRAIKCVFLLGVEQSLSVSLFCCHTCGKLFRLAVANACMCACACVNVFAMAHESVAFRFMADFHLVTSRRIITVFILILSFGLGKHHLCVCLYLFRISPRKYMIQINWLRYKPIWLKCLSSTMPFNSKESRKDGA